MFEKAYKNVLSLEFSNPESFLHYNKGESGYTLGGIYQTAHPNLWFWQLAKDLHQKYNSIKLASKELYNNQEVQKEIQNLYYREYWLKNNLGELNPKMGTQIFCYCVNMGNRAIKFSQRVCSLQEDGILGPNTIRVINSIDPDAFISKYSEIIANYYRHLAETKPDRYKHFLNGWLRRIEITKGFSRDV